MARRKPQTKTVAVLEVVCYKFAFDSVTKAAECLKLLSGAIQVEHHRDDSGDYYLIPLEESDLERRPASLELKVNVPFRPGKAYLALPERGTHPALFDPRLA